jgi:VIT1/CCC1 family predicted Fe2+/Mn2+ transporter
MAARSLSGHASPAANPRFRAVLDPLDRSSEVLFGLIMALTFTTTFEVAVAGRADVRAMLVGALGCNLAWGIVDGVMFVVTRSVEKSRFHSRIRAVQSASATAAARILEEELPDDWGVLLDGHDFERLAARAQSLPAPDPPRLSAADLRAGAAVCILVFLSTFPVALPFLLFRDLFRAARVSDATALVMLFVIGTSLGRHAGRKRPFLVGLTMVGLGLVLSAIAIGLGG